MKRISRGETVEHIANTLQCNESRISQSWKRIQRKCIQQKSRESKFNKEDQR